MLVKNVTKPSPLVKWVGGKRQLQDRILPLLQRDVDPGSSTYFEPFVGGGAMLFALQPNRAQISDLNIGLINLYLTVRDEPTEFYNSLQLLEIEYNNSDADSQKFMYSREREIFNSGARVGLEMAARFVFLNKAGFNGMYRENSSGAFNIPFGKRKSLSLGPVENILAVSEMLSNVSIQASDYRSIVKNVQQGDVVYFDPPYAPLSATSSFTGYTADGFTGQDQEELRDLVISLTNKKVRVVVSNSSAEHIRNLYAEFDQHEVLATRAVSAKTSGRSPVTELLITNFGHLQ